MQAGKEDLTAERVVVANARAGDRKTEDAIEHDRPADVAREGKARRGELRRFTVTPQIHAKLFQTVLPERRALADHERIERQLAEAVRAIVNEIPKRGRVRD